MIKPSKYDEDGYVQRFRVGYMPNVTLNYISSMTPEYLDTPTGRIKISVTEVDEMIESDLSYLGFEENPGVRNLAVLVGVQSHQLQRALDIAALAVERGALAILGGPHVMTCDIDELTGKGISFSKAEAELVWREILFDAYEGELKAVYGADKRWQEELDAPILKAPSKRQLRRHIIPLFGIYPARGCPFRCNFCSVIQIAGHAVRSQNIETTLESIRRSKQAGAKVLIFTSDNFNKYGDAPELLDAMHEENLQIPFFVQCDTQISEQEWLVEKLSRAGCGAIMVGAESFDRQTLLKAGKSQNHPEKYERIIRLCHKYGIASFFSNIVGFPDDTEKSVLNNIQELKRLNALVSWFYLLTPIPGTEQYEDFMDKGIITERNLDRFDATCPTWSHPHLSGTALKNLMFRCYDELYGVRDIASKFWNSWNSVMPANVWAYTAGYSALLRFKSRQRIHPMLGGLWQFRRDHVNEYLGLRRKFFGCELLPLPRRTPPNSDELASNIHAAKGSILGLGVSQ